jgi:hypothetical protein
LLTGLPAEEQYAAVELLRGTMVRHNAVVYRHDRPEHAQPVSFKGDAWLDFVPIRMPDTISVQERLPERAAAVLINRNHTYTDLYLPIDADQKKLVDAIDAERSIGEIARKHTNHDAARALFERLWWYDQVIFDTGRAKHPPRTN